jgi:hypothetical protein
MARRKPQDSVRVCIADTEPRQIELARYLRNTGNISSQFMVAADAFYHSYTLEANPNVSDTQIELAVSESILALSNQIHRILNYHRINHKIILPNEFLAQCGLAWGSSSLSSAMMPQQQSAVILPSVTAKVNLPTSEPVKYIPDSRLATDEDGDDRDNADNDPGVGVKQDSGVNISGLNVSQSVADFLNGTSGR